MKDIKKTAWTLNLLASLLTLNEVVKIYANEYMDNRRASDVNISAGKVQSVIKEVAKFEKSPSISESNPIFDDLTNKLGDLHKNAQELSDKLKAVKELVVDEQAQEKALTSTSSSTSSTLLSDPANVEKLKSAFNETYDKSKIVNNQSDELLSFFDKFRNYSTKGQGSSQFTDSLTVLIQNFQEYISSLTLIQNLMIFNISIGTLILNSILSIILIFYSESLISFFQLEARYPRISKYIKLRQKFQQFYFLMHIICIIVAVSAMIGINYLLFSVS